MNISKGRQTEPDMTADDIRDGNIHRPYNVVQRPAYGTAAHTTEKETWGFKNLGDFAQSVRAAKGVTADPRLIKNAPATYGTEGIGADGGFAVPPQFMAEIWDKIAGEDSLLGLTNQVAIQGNYLIIPKDETSAWDSSGGIQAYWESEAGQLTESKPLLENTTLRTNKLTALIPVSNELMEDAPSMDVHLRRKTPEKFDYKLQDAFINGSGVGQPLGVLNSGCLVSAPKGSGQAADTILYENIISMWSRLYAPCRKNAVWLINQDCEEQLLQMAWEGSSTSVPAYLPSAGASSSPYSTLLGRPVIPIQSCKTVGDKGDILLCDFSQYLTVIKGGGLRTDVSMHLYFDYDVLAYRFILRMTGQPWWRTYITPANGSNYLSCFVSLDERASG